MGFTSILTMINNLFTPKREVVCIDIGFKYIKGIFFSEGKIVEFFQEKREGQELPLANILKKYKLLSKKVKLALKGEDTLIRYIPFPKVEKKKIKEVVQYEISRYIPFPKEEIYFDVFVLDNNYGKDELLLLLAVIKKNFLDDLIKKLEKEKIDCQEINLQSIALLNLFLKSETTKVNTAIVDVGRESTLLNLVKGTIPYLSREAKVGGNTLCEKIASLKNLSLDGSEDFISNPDNSKEVIEIGESFFNQIVEEIRNSFDYFEVNTGERINKVYLTGGITKIKGIEAAISSSLDVRVENWNPLRTLNFSYKEDFSNSIGPFTVALGLGV